MFFLPCDHGLDFDIREFKKRSFQKHTDIGVGLVTRKIPRSELTGCNSKLKSFAADRIGAVTRKVHVEREGAKLNKLKAW